MAYVSQEKKEKLAPEIKKLCKEYGVKSTIGVRHHSTLVVNISRGRLDFMENHRRMILADTYAEVRNGHYYEAMKKAAPTSMAVNEFHIDKQFSGTEREFLEKLRIAMRGPDWFDESDPQTDYFHCAHYIDINIGKWDKPYVFDKTVK